MKRNVRYIIEQVIRAVSGGAAPADSKYPQDYILDLIPQARQTALSIYYNGAGDTGAIGNLKMGANKYIPYDFFQSTTLYYDSTIQDADANYLIFECATPLSINRDVNGFNFVGDRDSGKGFSRLRSAADAAAKMRLGAITSDNICYVQLGTQLRVYGNMDLQQIDIDAVFSNPSDVSGFNINTDDYPYPFELLNLLINVLKRDYMREESLVPRDSVLNANERHV